MIEDCIDSDTPVKKNPVDRKRSKPDEWRRDYNEDRPHEALGEVAPALIYRRSPRRYPRKLLNLPSWHEASDVDRYGCIRWRRRKLCVTRALAGEIVELERSGEWSDRSAPSIE